MHRLEHRHQNREINELLVLAVGHIGGFGIAAAGAHKCAAPDFAGDDAAADQLVISPADCLHAEAQIIGKVAMGRQPVTAAQFTRIDSADKRVGE